MGSNMAVGRHLDQISGGQAMPAQSHKNIYMHNYIHIYTYSHDQLAVNLILSV